MTAAPAPLLVSAALLGVAALCAGSSIGSACLQQPRNLTVDIVNANIILKWDWDNTCNLSVTFSAGYQEIPDYDDDKTISGNWTFISECQNMIVKECDLSSAELNYLELYIVNIRVQLGEDHSPWASLKFCPRLKAKIGPPGLQMESEYGDVKIIILHPEANQARKMWDMDTLNYKLAIWKNSSSPEEKNQDICSGQIIHDLEPETTYCLKIKAHLMNHIGLFSPVECIRTPKAWFGPPRPQNLHFRALDMKCLLYWDNLYDENVTFLVQLLHASKRCSSSDISKDWIPVSGCENITTPHCDFSSIDVSGIYYLRVQAMKAHNKSAWSREIEFEPKIHNEMGPPSVSINASDDSLYIFIDYQEELYKRLYGDLFYRAWYWENSSFAKEKVEDKSTPFTISGLKPSTLYCLKVQAYPQNYNKSSKFSNVTCITTGKSSYRADVQTSLKYLGITLGSAFVIVFLIYALLYLWRKIKDVFFPSCSLPMNIEDIERKDYSSYLITSEESTEKSIVVIDSSIPIEVNTMDFKDLKQQEQISEDSGHYSNDD